MPTSRIPVRCILFVSVLSGCSDISPPPVFTRLESLGSEEVSRVPISTSDKITVRRYPTRQRPRIVLSAHNLTVYEVKTSHHYRKIEEFKRHETFEEMRRTAGAAAIWYPLYVAGTPPTVSDRRIVPNSDFYKAFERKENCRTPYAGYFINVGDSRYLTDDDGQIVVAVKPDYFKDGVLVTCEPLDLKYLVRSIEKTCRGRSQRYELLKTGNQVYSIIGTIRLVFRLSLGRITPVGFVIGIVIDVITGAIIDYAIETLSVECYHCGYEWDMHRVRGKTGFKCPKCGSAAEGHFHIEGSA